MPIKVVTYIIDYMKRKNALMEYKKAIRNAICALGGVPMVAKICGIKCPSVYEWLAKGKIPLKRALYLEKLFPDKIKASDICKDYPDE